VALTHYWLEVAAGGLHRAESRAESRAEIRAALLSLSRSSTVGDVKGVVKVEGMTGGGGRGAWCPSVPLLAVCAAAGSHVSQGDEPCSCHSSCLTICILLLLVVPPCHVCNLWWWG